MEHAMDAWFQLDIFVMYVVTIILLVAAIIGGLLTWSFTEDLEVIDAVDDAWWRMSHYHEETFK
jgi:hypothetical protein